MCIRDSAHYAYLKIAEGCNNRCHYCAIPGIRGPLHSRDMADCVAEARWLAGDCLLYTSNDHYLAVYSYQKGTLSTILEQQYEQYLGKISPAAVVRI